MEKRNELMKYNLQFFADDPQPSDPQPSDPQPNDPQPNDPQPSDPQPNDPQPKEPELTLEQQVAKLTAQLNVYKKASDKNSSEAAEWKRKYRDTLTDKQKMDEEKLEQEAAKDKELEELRREVRVSKMANAFLEMGYSKEQAKEAATAQYDSDFEKLVSIQNEVMAAQNKKAVSDYMKTQPIPKSSNGSNNEDPFLKGFGE